MRNVSLAVLILAFATVAFCARQPQAHYRHDGKFLLPDPAVTPGARNPDVTQANIGKTICVRGWSASVRPPESYTEPLKRQIMNEYGDVIPDPHHLCFQFSADMGCYELDHFLAIEDGGEPGGRLRPAGRKNLWAQPLKQAHLKDLLENYLHRQVCERRMSLGQAQRLMLTDWARAYEAMEKRK